MTVRRARSCSTSTTPTSRCTAGRKAAFSMAIMMSSATYRSTCSAAGTCCWPAAARQRRRQRWRGRGRHASSPRSAGKRRCATICAANSGFADPRCGGARRNRVDHAFGLARNLLRLEAGDSATEEAVEAKRLCTASGRAARVFRDFRYLGCSTVGAGGCVSSARRSTRRTARILASSSPCSDTPVSLILSTSTRAWTAPAARPRPAAANSSNCSPIAVPPPPWRPTSCACGLGHGLWLVVTRHAVSVSVLHRVRRCLGADHRRRLEAGAQATRADDASTSRSPRLPQQGRVQTGLPLSTACVQLRLTVTTPNAAHRSVEP